MLLNLDLDFSRRPARFWLGLRRSSRGVETEIEIQIQQHLAQTTQAARFCSRVCARSASISRSFRTFGRNWCRRRRRSTPRRTCGALGIVLFHRSGKLDRPDVRQPVPRHLEGLLLVQERQGRCAAARGAPSRRSGQAPTAFTRRHPGIIVADAADIWITTASSCAASATACMGFEFTPIGSGADFRTMSLTSLMTRSSAPPVTDDTGARWTARAHLHHAACAAERSFSSTCRRKCHARP